MKKVLFVASVTRHINTFHIPYLKYFKEKGYKVHVASNGDTPISFCDKHFNLEFERSPFKAGNLKAYKELKKIIDEGEYEIVHCHTPVASVLTRLAAKNSRKEKGTRVIYTAHGFHFYKGAPKKNWLIYYPIEKYLSKYTDTLITINQEDYEIAKEKFHSKQIEHVHGVGIDESKFNQYVSDEELVKFKESLGLKPMDYIISYVAELNNNKNQIMIVRAMKEIVRKHCDVKMLLIGDGVLQEELRLEIKKNLLQNNVLLVGYRTDISMFLKISNLYIATSQREGLPVNILEAICAGLPIVVTNSRGQRELIKDGMNGYLVRNNDEKDLAQKIDNVYSDFKIRNHFKAHARDVLSPYLMENVFEEMKKIYTGEGV